MAQRIPSVIYPFVLLLVEHADGRYLLVQEAKAECRGTWFLPGGGVDPDETILQAAAREALEEAGIEIEVTGLLWAEFPLPEPHVPRYWRFALLARAVGGQLKTIPDDESLQAQWFAYEQLAGLEMRSPSVMELIDYRRAGAPVLPVEALKLRAWR